MVLTAVSLHNHYSGSGGDSKGRSTALAASTANATITLHDPVVIHLPGLGALQSGQPFLLKDEEVGGGGGGQVVVVVVVVVGLH